MRTIFLLKTEWALRKHRLGNHGRGIDSNNNSAIPQTVGNSLTPTRSSAAFISPEALLRPSSSIRDVVHDPQPSANQPTTASKPAQVAPAAQSATQPNMQPQSPEQRPAAPAQSATVTPAAPVSQVASAPVASPATASIEEMGEDAYNEAFRQHWVAMTDVVFDKIPILQAPLKVHLPEIRSNIIHLTLKSEFQQDEFESKKIEVLQYLRNHFDQHINEIEVTVDTSHNSKKLILNEDDKLIELRKQNPDAQDFITTLSLRLKN